jgi:plastocyanin
VNQIQYLFDLIRSADPAYLAKNGYPTGSGSNGFDQVPNILRQSQPSAYQTAVAQASGNISQFPVVDMTKQTAVTIDIIHAPANATCQPACYAIADPKNPAQMVISPDVKVKVGTTITWVNKDTTIHTVTAIMGENPGTTVAAPNIFDSGAASPISPGQTFVYKVMMNAYTFNTDHGVVYYCRVHPVMTAALTITLT